MFYAVLCLLQIKVAIRWGGFTLRAILGGTAEGLIALIAPIMIAFVISGTLNETLKKWVFSNCQGVINDSVLMVVISSRVRAFL